MICEEGKPLPDIDIVADLVRAEVKQQCIAVRVPAKNLRVSVERDVIGGAIIRVTQRLLEHKSDEVRDGEHIDFYPTWWDHFKADVLPLWARRWLKPSVQFHIPRVTQIVRQCPHIAIPESARHFEWLSFKAVL